ncbi:MAG: hypothetical protein HYZ42_02765 [Bacteroidetes bacterium]|nr:hypothetical protein [Bacteroidota bacterium]
MKKYLLLFFIFFTLHISQAQNSLLGDGLIYTQAQLSPMKDIKDSIGQYGFKNYIISARVPLYKKSIAETTGSLPRTSILTLNSLFGYQSTELSWLSNKQNIIRGNIGVSGLHFDGKKNMFLGTVNAFIANDDYTIYKPQVRYSAVFIYNHTTPKNNSYHLGLAYVYTFGRAITIPTVGVRFKLNEKSKLNINFPFGIAYFHRFQHRITI